MPTHNPVPEIWESAGCPDPNWQGKARTARPVPKQRHGTCALIGTTGPVVELRDVLSGLFTGYDRLPFQHAPDCGLSIPAAWAFRERATMQVPHAWANGRWEQVTPEDLYAVLAGPWTGPTLVTVPQSRQKHLLPYARTGHVRTDDECLQWGHSERDLLGTYRTLRSFGFGETALTEPAPRWVQLAKIPKPDHMWVVQHWPQLDGWRRHPALMDIAARATRTTKEPR